MEKKKQLMLNDPRGSDLLKSRLLIFLALLPLRILQVLLWPYTLMFYSVKALYYAVTYVLVWVGMILLGRKDPETGKILAPFYPTVITWPLILIFMFFVILV